MKMLLEPTLPLTALLVSFSLGVYYLICHIFSHIKASLFIVFSVLAILYHVSYSLVGEAC